MSAAVKMAARESGYLVHTASAAGLLSHIQSATYSVTKHAAVAFAEWVSIKYREQGVRVSVLAPQAVRTPMTARPDGAAVASVDGMIEPEELAECVVRAMAREEFLILPHPGVHDYMVRKVTDVDRWLRGMARWPAGARRRGRRDAILDFALQHLRRVFCHREHREHREHRRRRG